jgi:hypothetical protein
MDGTLIDSTAGVVGAWEVFAESYPHIDVKEILSCEFPPRYHRLIYAVCPASHGVRTVDNLRRFCGIDDPGLLEVDDILLTFLAAYVTRVLRRKRRNALNWRLSKRRDGTVP